MTSPHKALDIQASLGKLHEEIFGTSSAGNKPRHAANEPVAIPATKSKSPSDQAAVDAILASADAKKFLQFQTGDWAAMGYESQSEGDLAFAGMLARHVGPDAARIDGIFRNSAMMRDKWDESRGARTYGEMTIARALDNSDTDRCETLHGAHERALRVDRHRQQDQDT